MSTRGNGHPTHNVCITVWITSPYTQIDRANHSVNTLHPTPNMTCFCCTDSLICITSTYSNWRVLYLPVPSLHSHCISHMSSISVNITFKDLGHRNCRNRHCFCYLTYIFISWHPPTVPPSCHGMSASGSEFVDNVEFMEGAPPAP